MGADFDDVLHNAMRHLNGITLALLLRFFHVPILTK